MNRNTLQKMADLIAAEAWQKLAKEYPQLSRSVPGVTIKTHMRKDVLALALLEYNLIRLNETFYRNNYELFLSDVIPHEVAHVAAWQIFACENHGAGWKKCCKLLKIKRKVVYSVKHSVQ